MVKISDISIKAIKNGELQNELPEFYGLNDVFENNQWHHETTFEHVLLVLDEYENILRNNELDYLDEKLDNNPKADLLRVAILFHDIAKKETVQIAADKTTSFPNHEEKGALKARELLQRFDISENGIDFIVSLIKNHGKPHAIFGDREQFDKFLEGLRTEISATFKETMLLSMVDTLGSKLRKNNEEEFDFRIRKYKKVLDLN